MTSVNIVQTGGIMKFKLEEVKELVEATVKNPTPEINEFLDARWNSDHCKQFPYYRLFFHLTQRFKPEYVVELGGWRGDAASHFAAGNNSTVVITIDHHTDPGDEFHQIAMRECCEKYNNLRYIQGWTCTETYKMEKDKHSKPGQDAYPKLLYYLNDMARIDILFIDSWHQYDYVKRDWEAYKPLLKKPTLVIFDDLLEGDGPAIGGMRRFWDELEGEKFLNGGLHPGYPMGILKYE